MSTYAQRVASVLLSSAHFKVPNESVLRVAKPSELALLLPFSYPISLRRSRSVEERCLTVLYQPRPQVSEQETSSPRTSSESYLEKVYPFAVRQHVAQLYKGEAHGAAVNVGLFMEDFDSFAADIAGRHCGLEDKRLVTASVERLWWLPQAYQSPHQQRHATDSDMTMVGQVTWVGRSSMEVTLQLLTCEPMSPHLGATNAGDQDAATRTELPFMTASARTSQSHVAPASYAPQADRLVADCPAPRHSILAMARFLMAARDLSLQRSMTVPPLLPKTDVEMDMFKQGQERQLERSLHRAAAGSRSSSKVSNPSIRTASQAQASSIDAAAICSSCARAAASDAAQMLAGGADATGPAATAELVTASLQTTSAARDLMAGSPSSTEVHHQCLARYEDQNTTGTLFGGQALRLGFDVATAAATQHVGGARCDFLGVENAEFFEPIPIGAVISVVARVILTEGVEIHVAVHVAYTTTSGAATCHGPSPHENVTSLTLVCVFESRDALPL